MDQFMDPTRATTVNKSFNTHISVLDNALETLGVIDNCKDSGSKLKPMSAEQMLRDFSSRVASSQMSWFSIMPKRTCATQCENNKYMPVPDTLSEYNASNCSSPVSRTSGSATPISMVNGNGGLTKEYRHKIMEDLQFDSPQELPKGEW